MLPVDSGIEGERIRLRPLELGDAGRMQGWINDPEIRRYIGGTDYQYSLPAEEDYIRSMQQNDWEHGLHFAIEATDTGEPEHIGSVDLRNLHAEARSGEIGIMIGAREYWDRGYGTDVVRTICRFGFEDLDLHRIELTVAAYHPRAQRVYEKVGFIVEGRMREHRYIAGRYHDTLVMGLLRREFEALEAK